MCSYATYDILFDICQGLYLLHTHPGVHCHCRAPRRSANGCLPFDAPASHSRAIQAISFVHAVTIAMPSLPCPSSCRQHWCPLLCRPFQLPLPPFAHPHLSKVHSRPWCPLLCRPFQLPLPAAHSSNTLTQHKPQHSQLRCQQGYVQGQGRGKRLSRLGLGPQQGPWHGGKGRLSLRETRRTSTAQRILDSV